MRLKQESQEETGLKNQKGIAQSVDSTAGMSMGCNFQGSICKIHLTASTLTVTKESRCAVHQPAPCLLNPKLYTGHRLFSVEVEEVITSNLVCIHLFLCSHGEQECTIWHKGS